MGFQDYARKAWKRGCKSNLKIENAIFSYSFKVPKIFVSKETGYNDNLKQYGSQDSASRFFFK